MQRFVGEVAGEQGKDHFNTVLKHAMKGSNQYQRAISVMYDLGGFEPGTDRDEAFLLADAQYIMDTYKLKDRNQQKFYLHEDGKPLLALWGRIRGETFRRERHHQPGECLERTGLEYHAGRKRRLAHT